MVNRIEPTVVLLLILLIEPVKADVILPGQSISEYMQAKLLEGLLITSILLVITICIESVVAFAYALIRKLKVAQTILYIILANVLSYPVSFLLPFPLIGKELMAISIEASIFRFIAELNWIDLIFLSVIANGISAGFFLIRFPIYVLLLVSSVQLRMQPP